ncbi:MAG: serine protease Do, partial [Verrucomicrobiales bacterium]
EKVAGTGSGTIIHPDGYVVTNHHVAGNATRVWVRLSNKARVDAKVIGTDPQTDLCIIQLNMDQVPDSMKPLPVAKFGDFTTLEIGDTVLAMGSPAGVSQSVTLGVVANLEMIMPGGGGGLRQDGERVGDLVRWIGHDAVIYFGNSGGPLVNLNGEIIGVNEIGLGSLGGAIPADIAAYVTDELIKNKRVRRSWTGIVPQPLLRSQHGGVGGILVGSVVEGSPGEKAGLQAGDIITSFDGVEVSATAPEHLPLYNKVVLGTPVEKQVEVKVSRDGKVENLKLVTVERSKAQGGDHELKAWGITARDITTRSAISMKRETTDGVWVSSIGQAGAAASAKPALQPRDIIVSVEGNPVKAIADLVEMTEKLLPDGTETFDALVEYERSGEQFATVVTIGRKPNDSNSSAADRAWIGVKTQVLTRDLAKALKLGTKKGVRITQVIPGTKAEEAGFQKGDVLLKMDGAVIQSAREQDSRVFESMVREYSVGDETEFDLVRAGETSKMVVELQSAPTLASEFDTVTNDTLEFTLRELSSANADEAEIGKGIFVVSVARAGWASLAGLAGGDVILALNGAEVHSVDAMEKDLKAIEGRKDDYIVLFVKRGKLTRFVEIQPIWN